MALVSPGVEITLNDDSAFVSGEAVSTPLIFIATAAEKTQSDGISAATGTYEHGVVRTVTSKTQANTLYGYPRFLSDESGNQNYGDARNEYGLDAVYKALDIASSVFVVRANVNLNDDIDDIKTLWTNNAQDAADQLSADIQAFIDTFNNENDLIASDDNFKETVDASELKTLISESFSDVFNLFNFSTDEFQNAFLNDHDTPTAGYVEVNFDTTGGFITSEDATGLDDATQYGADLEIVTENGTESFTVTTTGEDSPNFGALIANINSVIGSAGTAELLNGFIRISSSLDGVTSVVEITTDGPSGMSPLFSSLNLFSSVATPVFGTGSGALNTYDPTYTTVIGSYDGLDHLIDTWTSGSVVSDEFTATEAESLVLVAASDFDQTKEFKMYSSLGTNDTTRRAAIVKALQAEINGNQDILSDTFLYNLVAAPGYYECTDELANLAETLKFEVFVVGDSPLDKAPTGPSGITVWADTPDRVDNYINAYWYPHAITSNMDGSDIMSSAGTIALRTLLLSDSLDDVFFAPLGVRNGAVSIATNLGYASGTLGTTNTFTSDLINQGTRDVLYQKAINPFSHIINRGILAMGQKTSSPATSALDRINVVRLTCKFRRDLREALFPFLGLPNDEKTWSQVRYAVNNYMAGFVSRRGIYDFFVEVDSTNNTDATIDANELHIGIYFTPVKDVEFIYVDLNVERTGTDLSTLVS